MLVLDNVLKLFEHDEIRTRALNNVSLTINQGDFVAVTGPSGCGKSTLLNVIGLLASFDDGSYQIDDIKIEGLSEVERRKIRNQKISFIFQNFNLIDDLSVYQNVELPLLYQKMDKAEREKRINDVLEKIDISHRAGHFPRQLSGGQQQRVAVARSIVNQPRIILADEPTGNLDSKHRSEVMELLKDLNCQGTTILMVTHSVDDAKYANKEIKLLDGSVQ